MYFFYLLFIYDYERIYLLTYLFTYLLSLSFPFSFNLFISPSLLIFTSKLNADFKIVATKMNNEMLYSNQYYS